MAAIRDPVPLDRVVAALANVDPSQQKTRLHAAWMDYATTATRPLAWPSFFARARDHALNEGVWIKHAPQDKLAPWEAEAPAAPVVLVLNDYASLRVRRGALEIEHGPRDAAILTRIDVDTPKPRAILFDGTRGEFLTGDAIRFCVRHSIALIFPGGPGRPPIGLVEQFGETRGRAHSWAAKGRTEDGALAQAKCALDKEKTITIAREIVRAKIAAQTEILAASRPEVCEAVAQWAARLSGARTLTDLLLLEAYAATAYWAAYREAGLRPRKNADLPRSWLRFAQRNKGSRAFREAGGGPRAASHPIAAMLNYCYVVEAGRLARALTARGLILQFGFLHSPKRGRASLVWDAMEILRPTIDARVFAFVGAHEFARSDFIQADRAIRLSRGLASALLHAASLSSRQIDGAADWAEATIARVAGE
jgi:CRISPR-associated endonuclease Cas1